MYNCVNDCMYMLYRSEKRWEKCSFWDFILTPPSFAQLLIITPKLRADVEVADRHLHVFRDASSSIADLCSTYLKAQQESQQCLSGIVKVRGSSTLTALICFLKLSTYLPLWTFQYRYSYEKTYFPSPKTQTMFPRARLWLSALCWIALLPFSEPLARRWVVLL